MQIYGLDELESAPRGAVIAIGFFDGVHFGHRSLIAKARNEARDLGVPFGVFTFTSESGIKGGVKRLQDTETKLDNIGYYKPDFITVVDFKDVCDLTPEQFVTEIIVKRAGASVAVIGENFRFGKGAVGTAEDLKRLMMESGGDAIIHEMQEFDGVLVSSSLIRRLIEDGEIKRANRLLVNGYSCKGTVVHGNGEGRGLGFPTVNCRPDGVIPKRRGVYYTGVQLDGEFYYAVTNVGTCPTLGEREVHLETYMLGYEGDAYGKEIVIHFYDFLRDEMKFENRDALIEQVKRDIETVRLAGEENDRAMREVEELIKKLKG